MEGEERKRSIQEVERGEKGRSGIIAFYAQV